MKLQKIKKAWFGLLCVFLLIVTFSKGAFAKEKVYEYSDGVSEFDYSQVKDEKSESQKNYSNPSLTESRFNSLQLSGVVLSKDTANKHWERKDLKNDGYGSVVWDPATATITIDSVNFGEFLKRYNDALNRANNILYFDAVDPDDTVTIKLKGQNIYKPMIEEVKKALAEHNEKYPNQVRGPEFLEETVSIQANCNIVIEAIDNASLELQAYDIFRGNENSRPAINASSTSGKRDVTIKGGHLKLSAYKDFQTISARNVVIENSVVEAISNEGRGIVAEKSLNISGDSKVTVTSNKTAMQGENITILNGVVKASSTSGYGIYTTNGNIDIKDGQVKAISAEKMPAILARVTTVDNKELPKVSIILGDTLSSLNNKLAVTNWIQNGENWYADSIFVPNDVTLPIENTDLSPNQIEIKNYPQLALDSSTSSDLNVVEDSKIVTGKGLLNNDNASVAKTVDEVRKLFKDVDSDYKITIEHADGSVMNADELVGTGCVVVLKDGEEIIDYNIIVVMGDVTGNGIIDTDDAVKILDTIAKPDENKLAGAYELAACVKGKETYNTDDVVKIQDIIVKAMN